MDLPSLSSDHGQLGVRGEIRFRLEEIEMTEILSFPDDLNEVDQTRGTSI